MHYTEQAYNLLENFLFQPKVLPKANIQDKLHPVTLMEMTLKNIFC